MSAITIALRTTCRLGTPLTCKVLTLHCTIVVQTHQSEWAQHSEGSQRLCIEPLQLHHGEPHVQESDHHDCEVKEIPRVSFVISFTPSILRTVLT